MYIWLIFLSKRDPSSVIWRSHYAAVLKFLFIHSANSALHYGRFVSFGVDAGLRSPCRTQARRISVTFQSLPATENIGGNRRDQDFSRFTRNDHHFAIAYHLLLKPERLIK